MRSSLVLHESARRTDGFKTHSDLAITARRPWLFAGPPAGRLASAGDRRALADEAHHEPVGPALGRLDLPAVGLPHAHGLPQAVRVRHRDASPLAAVSVLRARGHLPTLSPAQRPTPPVRVKPCAVAECGAREMSRFGYEEAGTTP